MPADQPTVFLSSTIYDFRDMRSAIKYFLEELGYRVLLSEFNDFRKPLDRNSYAACIAALEQAQYFVLLIGGRIGGWYNEQERVSITQLEYRTAYERVRAGRMKLISFVRSEIWALRHDRELLRTMLEKEFQQRYEIGDEDITAIANHRSDLVNDSDAVFAFLAEVARSKEMKAATAKGSGFPTANWVHQFTTFRDIADVLRTEFHMSKRLSRVAIEQGLKSELLAILQQMTWKAKNGEINKCTFFGKIPRDQLGPDFDSKTHLSGDQVVWLVMYLTAFRLSGSSLPTQFIDEALISGEFLAFDPRTDGYSLEGPHEQLQHLRENIVRLRSLIELSNKPAWSFLDRYSHASRVRQAVTVPSADLVSILSVFDCQDNVILLARLFYAYLAGRISTVPNVPLNSTSPLAVEAAQIANERPTAQEVEVWALGKPDSPSP